MEPPPWLPTDADPAPSGFLYIDVAVDEVQQRLGWSQGRAGGGLLDAFVSGEIATRRRQARSYCNGHEHFDRENWRGARLNVEAFRRQRRGGAVVLGRDYHLHRFLMHAADFVTWLKTRAGGEAQEVVPRAPGKRDVPQMDHCTADALRPDSEAATTQAATRAATTIGSRTRWQKWLETQMRISGAGTIQGDNAEGRRSCGATGGKRSRFRGGMGGSSNCGKGAAVASGRSPAIIRRGCLLSPGAVISEKA
jgi:hypothetical protein